MNLFSVHLSQGNLKPLGQCLDRPRAFVLIILCLSLQKPEATVKQMLSLFSFCHHSAFVIKENVYQQYLLRAR